METKNNGMRNLDEDQSPDNRLLFTEYGNTTSYSKQQSLLNKETDPTDQQRTIEENHHDRHRYHPKSGNRRYKMFSNHSSANDQPYTNTDTRP